MSLTPKVIAVRTQALACGHENVFIHNEVDELVNLQNVGGQAKPYQIRQFLRLVERYNLNLEDREP